MSDGRVFERGMRVCLGQFQGGSKEEKDKEREQMKRSILDLGGKVVGTVGPRTDVLLTSVDDARSEKSAKVQKAWIHSKPVVSLDWLDACKARSLFVETSPHAFANPSSSGTRSTSCVRTSATSTQESASGTDKDENRDNPYPLPYLAKGPGGFKRTATSLSSGGSSKRHQANPPHKCAAKPVKIPVPIANKAPEGCPETTPRGAADPAAQLEGGILLPGWECLLTIPASATGDQSNYAMQLIVQDLGQGAGLERSYVFVRWGFSEQRGSMCRLNGPYDTIGEAQGFFRRRFKDKTGVDWGSGAGAQPGASSKAHPHRIVFVPMPAAEASVSQLETKGLVKMILDRSVIEHVLLLSGLAPHLSGDLLPQRSWSTMPFNSRENSTGGFLLSQQCAMDYRMSDCQQKDMQDLPAPVLLKGEALIQVINTSSPSELLEDEPLFGAGATLGQDASKPLGLSASASGSDSKIDPTSSLDGFTTTSSKSKRSPLEDTWGLVGLNKSSASSDQLHDVSSLGLSSFDSSGRQLTSSAASTPGLSLKALRVAYANLDSIAKILRLKSRQEVGPDTCTELKRLSTEFYKFCLQRGGDETVIDTKEMYLKKMVQMAVLAEVVSKCSIDEDCISSNGAATICYPDGVRTALTPIEKGSEPEDLARLLNSARGMGEQQQNVAGIWAVGHVLPFDGSLESTFRAPEGKKNSESNLLWYPTTAFGLAAVFHSSTVTSPNPSGNQDEDRTCLFEAFGDAFGRMTKFSGISSKDDIFLALLCEPQTTSPTVLSPDNGCDDGSVTVNPLNLPLIGHLLDAAILPINNYMYTNGKSSLLQDFPEFMIRGANNIFKSMSMGFDEDESLPMMPSILTSPNSSPGISKSSSNACSADLSPARYVIRYIVAIRITKEPAKLAAGQGVPRQDSSDIGIGDSMIMRTLF